MLSAEHLSQHGRVLKPKLPHLLQNGQNVPMIVDFTMNLAPFQRRRVMQPSNSFSRGLTLILRFNLRAWARNRFHMPLYFVLRPRYSLR